MPSDLLERRDEVEAALADLSEGDRALVVLRFRHGLDYSELALTFGIKEGTARMRLSRALARMRTTLNRRAAGAARRLAPAGAGAVRRALPKKRARMRAQAPVHPLTRYFTEAWGPVSDRVRDRLLG
jgi:hypothetical protein